MTFFRFFDRGAPPTGHLPLSVAVAAGLMLVLAACGARYPLGMSKAEWERLTPQQQHEARMKQGDINKARAQRRANAAAARAQAAAARRARDEAGLRRVQALYDEGRWGDIVECVVEGGMADFHPGWRRFQPVPFTLARGESKRITLREQGRRTGGFYASFSGNGGELRICYRDPRHWGRHCSRVPVSRRGFSYGYASRITVRDVFQNAQLYCAYRPGDGMPRVRLHRDNHRIWMTLYRYHYPRAPRPSRVIYYDRRYHGHRARRDHGGDYRRRPQPRYEKRYGPRYDDRPRHQEVRERDRRREDRDRYARERERERINPRPTTGAAAAAKAYIDRTRGRDEPQRDRRARRNDRPDSSDRHRARRDDRPDSGDRHRARRDDRRDGSEHGRPEKVHVGKAEVRVGDDIRVRGDDVRVGNVRVRRDDVRIGGPAGRDSPPGRVRTGGPPASERLPRSALSAPPPSSRRGSPPGHARRGRPSADPPAPMQDVKSAVRKGPPTAAKRHKPRKKIDKAENAVKKQPLPAVSEEPVRGRPRDR